MRSQIVAVFDPLAEALRRAAENKARERALALQEEGDKKFEEELSIDAVSGTCLHGTGLTV